MVANGGIKHEWDRNKPGELVKYPKGNIGSAP